MFNILLNVKWTLMNNFFMNSGKTLFNLYEVIISFQYTGYNNLSPTG